MKSLLITITLMSALMSAAGSYAGSLDRWISLYGEKIKFDVFRKDKLIGHYLIHFNNDGERSVVEVEMALKVPIFLGWSYNYRYVANEYWSNNSLKALEVFTNENGKKTSFQAVVSEGKLRPRTNGNAFKDSAVADMPILLTHHYNQDVLLQNRVFNTLQAREIQIDTYEGESTLLEINGSARPVREFNYGGELADTRIWFDEKGKWVKMIFPGTDGTPIELRCRLCG